jgi:hypothetical protein
VNGGVEHPGDVVVGHGVGREVAARPLAHHDVEEERAVAQAPEG